MTIVAELREEMGSEPELLDLLRALLVLAYHRIGELLDIHTDVELENAHAKAREGATHAFRSLRSFGTAASDGVLTVVFNMLRADARGVVVLAVAEALDEVFRPELRFSIRRRGEYVLRSLDVVYADGRERLARVKALGQPGTNPLTLDGTGARTTCFRLLELPQELAVVDDWRFGDAVALAQPRLPGLAVGLPNQGLADHYTWDDHPEKRPKGVYICNVRPTAPEQARTLEALIGRAGAEGVRILLFPELCQSQVSPDGQRRAFEEATALRLFVMGSEHLDGQNVATVLLRPYDHHPAVVALNHQKFFPMDFKPRHNPVSHREFLDKPQRLLRLVRHVGRDDAVTCWLVLICKDALMTSVQGFLCDQVRPDMLLVPSMSPVTLGFETLGERLAEAQCTMVYGNTCDAAAAKAHVALLSLPVTQPLVGLRRDEVVPPVLCVFQSDDGEHQWRVLSETD